ncbi:MAG TPA: hypothetical protein H9831_02335, partial [Candidatus Eisenbergiella pullistercoris]|nr:hypothetical protein [Candidatus Eisenbergiella pullistercoris]
VQPSAELLRHPAIPIASRWAGCFLPIRFRTVCAVNAQTWLNCYDSELSSGRFLTKHFSAGKMYAILTEIMAQ